jgi:subtilisin family serine protease
LPIRVLNGDGQGDISALLLAVEWAVNMGADVINLSLGSHEYVDGLSDVMYFASGQGVYTVAAAGNSGDTNVLHPAAGSLLISNDYALLSVGSVDKNDARSSFSTYGNALEYVAPGEKVFGAYPEARMAYFTGTSFATPLVTGTLALYLSDAPNATIQAFDDSLLRGADTNSFSHGRLNVAGGYTYLPVSGSVPSALGVSLGKNGSWTKSAGRSSTSSSNPRMKFDVTLQGEVIIDLTSTIDTYLYMLNSSGQVIAQDDDGGSGYNSRISMSLAKGSYTVVAATYKTGESGSFNLKVQGNVANLQ